MPDPSVGQSGGRRWTLAINEQGSVIGQWVPGCEVVKVMPVAEHEVEIERLRRAGAILRDVAKRPVESSIVSIDAAIAMWDEAVRDA